MVPTPLLTPAEVQHLLGAIHNTQGLETALQRHEQLAFDWGYLDAAKLEDNLRLSFYDTPTGIDFRLQINKARSRYTSALPPLPEGARCRICAENQGSPTKENLRIYRFPLAPGRDFFFQWTPFPLFPSHGVLIQAEHSPMRMDRQALDDGAAFLTQAPGYTFFSNSDRLHTGASILEHLHYQVGRARTLPVMEARVRREFQAGPVAVAWLDYPLAAVRLTGPSAPVVAQKAEIIIEAWKGLDPVHHSLNLVWRTLGSGASELILLFRSQEALPPQAVMRYKTEGVGVIEAGGEFIFPVPSGPEAAPIEAEIREQGKAIILQFLGGMDPWKEAGGDHFRKMERLLSPLAHSSDR